LLVAACGGGAVLERGVRALASESIAREMIARGLRVASAIGYVVIALTFHATLMGLVVGRISADLRYISRHDGLGTCSRRAMEETLLLGAAQPAHR
jgi:hypothetical protein